MNQNPAITNQPSEADLLEALEHNCAVKLYFEQIQNTQVYDNWIRIERERIRKASDQLNKLQHDRADAQTRVAACISRHVQLTAQLVQVRSDRSKAAAERRSDRQGERQQAERLTLAQKLELWERAMTWMVSLETERRHAVIHEWNQITDKAEKERWLIEQYQADIQSGGGK